MASSLQRKGMVFQNETKLAARLAAYGFAAILALQNAMSCAAAATIEFSGTVAGSPGLRVWPEVIVSFSDRAILPLGEVCGQTCDGLTISQEEGVAVYELVRIRGRGLAAIVPLEREVSNLTACAPSAGCMSFEVRREMLDRPGEP